VRYFPNVPVLGLVNFVSKRIGNDTQLPYGVRDGVYYLAGMEQETFDAHPTRAVTLAVMVTGLFSPEHPGIVKGSYVYVADRQERTGEFLGTNNLSLAFPGDYIQSCEVTKVSGDGPLQLWLNERGKLVFDSAMMATNVVRYERP